jgi:hypothetical protein
MDQNFVHQMLQLGILSYKEQETLWQIAKRCAGTAGISMGGAGALMGLKAGTVTVPGVGTVSGAVAGFLAGLTAGTASCVMLNQTYKNELRKLASGQ